MMKVTPETKKYIMIAARHTGKLGAAGTERTEEMYAARVGKAGIFYNDELEEGKRALFCFLDEAGQNIDHKGLHTTKVEAVHHENNKLFVTTRNTVYEFEEVE